MVAILLALPRILTGTMPPSQVLRSRELRLSPPFSLTTSGSFRPTGFVPPIWHDVQHRRSGGQKPMILLNELQRLQKLQSYVKPARRQTMPTNFAETKAKSSGFEVSATDRPGKRVSTGALARVLIAAII